MTRFCYRHFHGRRDLDEPSGSRGPVGVRSDRSPIVPQERRRALISVSDKSGVDALARGLVELGFEILSTGGTLRHLEQRGVAVTPVSAVTGSPEILDGRVKTLHPRIHGAILADRTKESHRRELAEQGIVPIDVVVVNLYPFRETLRQAGAGATEAEMVEVIDIGGPAMTRAAAKNYRNVVIVVDPATTTPVLDALRAGGGVDPGVDAAQPGVEGVPPHPGVRRRDRGLAGAASEDAGAPVEPPAAPSSAPRLPRPRPPTARAPMPPRQRRKRRPAATERLPPARHARARARVRAALRREPASERRRLLDPRRRAGCSAACASSRARICRGTTCSTPTRRASWWRCSRSPRSSWSSTTIRAASAAASISRRPTGARFECDPVSAYGSIVALNGEATGELAAAMRDLFVEVVIAPGYSAEALEIYGRKKNLRLIEAPPYRLGADEVELRGIDGGFLAQRPDGEREDPTGWRCVTRRRPTPAEQRALEFAWKVTRYVKSNAIVLANADQTVGVGAGQMSRVDSCRLAIQKAVIPTEGTVAGSDAFFPFRDGVDVLAAAGVRAIAQPGGSVRDEEVIAACDERDMAMVLTDRRHFRH